MDIFFDRTPSADVNKLISLYRPEEFQSPTRSTVPLISLFKHGAGLLDALMTELVGGREASKVHFEYKVGSPQGVGKPSHTDAMLIRGNRACALEAKWTEPPYSNVDTWIGEGESPENRKAVLSGWLSLLQPFACRPLKLEDFRLATYQTVHRAASACAAGDFPALAYVQFSPLPELQLPSIDGLKRGLSILRNLLGSECRIPIKLIEVTLKPTTAFDRIKNLRKGCPETAQAVQAAFGSEVFFEFLNLKTHPIS